MATQNSSRSQETLIKETPDGTQLLEDASTGDMVIRELQQDGDPIEFHYRRPLDATLHFGLCIAIGGFDHDLNDDNRPAGVHVRDPNPATVPVEVALAGKSAIAAYIYLNECVGTNKSQKYIAQKMDISTTEVEDHLTEIRSHTDAEV